MYPKHFKIQGLDSSITAVFCLLRYKEENEYTWMMDWEDIA